MAFISGIILLYLSEQGERRDEFGFKRIIAALCAFVLLGLILLIAVRDLKTPLTLILTVIIVIWISLTVWSASRSFAATFVSMSIIICICLAIGDRPWNIYKTNDGFELRFPLTYWITRHADAKGIDTVSYRIRGKRGNVKYNNLSDIMYVTVNGLRDSAGRLHLPNICSYEDGYTECFVEYHKADFNNVELFHLCRPDGTSSRIDVTGKNADSEKYLQPTYYNNETDFTY